MGAVAAGTSVGGPGKVWEAMEACRTGSWAHSPIYLFMVENFDRCAEAWADKKVRWARMAAAFAEDGLTNLDGGAAQPETLKKTWYRVRAKVAEGRVRLAEEAERKARERLRRKHERDILEAARNVAAPHDIRTEYDKSAAQDRWHRSVYAAPAAPYAPPAASQPSVPAAVSSPQPWSRPAEPPAPAPELSPDDPLLLSPLASQEELDRSDQDWPFQKDRAEWGEIRVITQATIDAQNPNVPKWDYGPDLPTDRGMERLPLKMTFKEESDWLRCWAYLFDIRQRTAPIPPTIDELLMRGRAGSVLRTSRMEMWLERREEMRKNK